MLLSKKKRREYFKYLSLGEYNSENIKKLQKTYFTREKDIDGEYGPDTDKLLRHVYNVTKYAPNFDPEEFRCGCGGKYCSGYPSYMKQKQLKHIQTIRQHYNKAMTVTCGLRCSAWNRRLNGAASNSKHLTGKATDFFMRGVTDTLERRKKAINYIKTLPDHNYTYGNGCSSLGPAVYAPNMGNAVHTDTK